jgi:hypothetical protein
MLMGINKALKENRCPSEGKYLTYIKITCFNYFKLEVRSETHEISNNIFEDYVEEGKEMEILSDEGEGAQKIYDDIDKENKINFLMSQAKKEGKLCQRIISLFLNGSSYNEIAKNSRKSIKFIRNYIARFVKEKRMLVMRAFETTTESYQY